MDVLIFKDSSPESLKGSTSATDSEFIPESMLVLEERRLEAEVLEAIHTHTSTSTQRSIRQAPVDKSLSLRIPLSQAVTCFYTH